MTRRNVATGQLYPRTIRDQTYAVLATAPGLPEWADDRGRPGLADERGVHGRPSHRQGEGAGRRSDLHRPGGRRPRLLRVSDGRELSTLRGRAMTSPSGVRHRTARRGAELPDSLSFPVAWAETGEFGTLLIPLTTGAGWPTLTKLPERQKARYPAVFGYTHGMAASSSRICGSSRIALRFGAVLPGRSGGLGCRRCTRPSSSMRLPLRAPRHNRLPVPRGLHPVNVPLLGHRALPALAGSEAEVNAERRPTTSVPPHTPSAATPSTWRFQRYRCLGSPGIRRTGAPWCD